MLALKQAFVVWTSGFQLHNGKYTVERDIAQGGFGITYLARANSNERVVIKTLNERVQQRPDFAKFQQDFVNEALRLAKCNHPNIVKVCEVFQQGQLWCMVMQYIEGEHLADRVLNQGVLSEPEALGYIRQIGEALTVVHQNGLLHRDVKPANIILRSNPQQAVLIDFGIAREFTQNLTLLHTANLSHCFAPIEQYQSVAKRGAYTDVYALAATLYFVLTKRLPEPAINRANGTLLVEPQKINPSISDRVNRAILKGMEIEPQDRPQLMQEWLELLKEPPQAVQPNQPPQPVGVRSVTPTPHSSVIIPWDYLLRVVLYYSVYSFFLAPWAVPVAVYGSMTLAVDVALGLSIISDEFVPLFFTMAVATAFFRVLCWSPLNVLSGSVYSFLAGVWAPLRFGVAGIAWILAFFLAGFLAFSVGLLTAFPVGLFQRQLSTTFLSKWLRFVIVATTSCLGVGLGWLVYQIFPIFGHH
ncbi:MAG: serine/threonine protein kinase [Aetokthonos hydrillicola CCALA 1050]|nr:serine/threonine protein kinase [Aetokthonos hydrillicola CCALA 1050]MBW4585186.1 serine/threonine protein kinase [Aetokthonos hydrillicola CCALA 1050]